MTFKQTKGNTTIEACVMPSPGGMFKGAVRVMTVRDKKTIEQITGRGCGRSVNTADAALELAESAARKTLRV